MLIGHSYGCYLVNRLASTEEAREKVAAVVLIGAGYPVPGYKHLRWIFYLPLFVSSLYLSCSVSTVSCMVKLVHATQANMDKAFRHS